MHKLVVFTSEEIKKIHRNEPVVDVDRKGIKTIYMSEACYKAGDYEEVFEED